VPAAAAAALAWWIVATRWPELRTAIAIILVAFLAAFPLRLYHATLQGLQDLPYLGKVQLTSWATGTIVTITLVLAGFRLEALAAGWVTTQAASAMLCAARLRSHFNAVWSAPECRPTLNEARELFGRSGWVSLSQIGQVFLSGSDVLVLGAILGPAATVPYACTGKLITVLANHPQLLMQAAAPAIAEMRTSANRSDVTRVAVALMRAMLILSGAVGCFVLLANEAFVSWWVGAEQFAGTVLTLLLLGAMLARHFATTLIYALFSFGHERRLSLAGISDGIVTLVVTLLLVRFTSLGVLAAAIGSLAGVMLVTIPVCGVALARELQIGILGLTGSLRSWAIRFAVVAALSFFASPFVVEHGLPGIIAGGIAIGLIYLGSMWTLLTEPPLGTYVRTTIGVLSQIWPRTPAHESRPPAVEPRL
jgi:O-antigen/teichoic acid export membrane protein